MAGEEEKDATQTCEARYAACVSACLTRHIQGRQQKPNNGCVTEGSSSDTAPETYHKVVKVLLGLLLVVVKLHRLGKLSLFLALLQWKSATKNQKQPMKEKGREARLVWTLGCREKKLVATHNPSQTSSLPNSHTCTHLHAHAHAPRTNLKRFVVEDGDAIRADGLRHAVESCLRLLLKVVHGVCFFFCAADLVQGLLILLHLHNVLAVAAAAERRVGINLLLLKTGEGLQREENKGQRGGCV